MNDNELDMVPRTVHLVTLTPREFLETVGREEDEPVPGSLEELIETASSRFY